MPMELAGCSGDPRGDAPGAATPPPLPPLSSPSAAAPAPPSFPRPRFSHPSPRHAHSPLLPRRGWSRRISLRRRHRGWSAGHLSGPCPPPPPALALEPG